MSEFTSTLDSAASGTSDGSEIIDFFNFERPFQSINKEAYDKMPLLNSSKTKDTHHFTRNKRFISQGELENGWKSKEGHKDYSPYKRHQSARKGGQADMVHGNSEYVYGTFQSSEFIDESRQVFSQPQQIAKTAYSKLRNDYSPDSGLGNTTASPIGYGVILDSSGLGSETDTFDIGTPSSADLYMSKVTQSQFTTGKLRAFLQTRYTEIKDELSPEELADKLDSKDLIGKTDREKITEMTYRDRKSDRLIKCLTEKSLKIREEEEEKFVKQVLKSFEEAKYGYLLKSFAEFQGSECDTPHTSSAIQNQTSTDSNEKKTTISLRKFIVKYFAFLKAEIDPTRLIDTLCIDGVISNDIVEKIKSEKLRAGKCDLLFKSISKATYNNDDSKILEKVKFAFESAGYGHVLKTLEDETEFETIQSDESHLPKDVKQVLSSTPFWEDELEPLQVIDVLVSKNICSLEEHENIRNAETRKLRSALLKEKFCSLKEKEKDVFFSISYAKYPRLSEDFKVEARKKNQRYCRYKMIVTHRQDDQLFYEQHRWASGEKAHDADTVVTLKFASHGKEQAFISPLDFDERLVDVIDFLQKCCDSVEFLEEWLPLIFTEKDVERLRLNCIDELLIKIKVNILDSQKVACQCSLTIEKIVQQYSYLERNLESADEIIETFSRFEGFNKDMKLFFSSLLDRSHLTRKDCFLRYLLDYPCTRIQFCLLEKEMSKKNLQLLKHVAEVQKSETEHLLTVRQIRSNKTFLCNELEPRYFIEMLSGLAGDENILEKIMSNAPRQKRCGKLIELVIYRKLVPRFMQELERCNKSHLVEFITGHRKNHGQTDIKYSLIKHYERIIDEIEPMLMRNVFVERIGPRAYENIQTLPRRRQRAKCLMRNILKGNENIGKTFLDALEIAGYVHLLESLTTDIESHKECPKLYQSLNGDHEEFVINSIFKLEFLDNKGKDKQKRFKEESNMQEEAKLKRQRTCEWVQLHYQ